MAELDWFLIVQVILATAGLASAMISRHKVDWLVILYALVLIYHIILVLVILTDRYTPLWRYLGPALLVIFFLSLIWTCSSADSDSWTFVAVVIGFILIGFWAIHMYETW